MRRKRRRHKKKRNVIIRRVSSYIQTYDSEHLISLGIISTIIVGAVGWWTEEGEKAVVGCIFVFFLCLSLSAGFRTFSLIYDAVKGVYDREHLLHAVVKLVVIGIALIALEDYTWFIVKVSIVGISFIVFVMLFSIVLNWLKK